MPGASSPTRKRPQRLAELDRAGAGFDEGLWSELAAAGILSAALPEHAGGDGLGLLEQCSVLIEIGRAVARAPYLTSIVLGAGAIARFGSDEQIARWARSGRVRRPDHRDRACRAGR